VRWALVIRELGRFGVVGVVNVTMYYAIYLVLHLLFPYLVAHVVAYVATIGTSFLLNCYFTYRTRPTLRKFLLFPLTQVAGLIVTSVGVTVLVEWAGMGERIAPVVATALAVPVSFVLSRRIIKGRRSRSTTASDSHRGELVLSRANLG
jgi:putative flippase GtrA